MSQPQEAGSTPPGSGTNRDIAPTAGPGGRNAGRVLAMAGAIMLMAMSAAGPGFITQTATFTGKYGASFAAAIVASVLIDILIQLNVWRVIGLSGLRAQDLANTVLPYSGHVLAALVTIGGLTFCLGNVAGAGQGLHDLAGVDVRVGAVLSAAVAIGIFSYKAMEGTFDKAVVALGVVKIGLILFVAIKTDPPVGEALVHTFRPQHLDFLPVLTLIGGTVGGYITYAGAHRLVEAGTTGPANMKSINRGSVNAVLVTGVLRILLFLGILGVVATGVVLSSDDPAGSAFFAAAGGAGRRIFGLVLWTAGMTSIIGASFTSMSFLKTLIPAVRNRFNLGVSAFVAVCTIGFLLIGKGPKALLVFAGAFNGLILPFGLAVILWIAWRRRDLLAGHTYPKTLLVLGILAWLFTVYAGWDSLRAIPSIFS